VLNKAAEELENSNQPMIAGYARQLAGGVQSVSTTLRARGVEDLFGMVGDFARKQPAMFIGAAALLGFAASRFLLASAKRQQTAPMPSSGNDIYRPNTYGSSGSGSTGTGSGTSSASSGTSGSSYGTGSTYNGGRV